MHVCTSPLQCEFLFPGAFVIFNHEYMCLVSTQNSYVLPVAPVLAFCLVSDRSSVLCFWTIFGGIFFLLTL